MKIYTLGGYEEVGKNMTAIEVDSEVMIIDMGLRIDRMMIDEDTNLRDLTSEELCRLGAIPDDSLLSGKKVVGIILSHGHLDHIGAITKLSEKYECPIISRPYTSKIANSLMREEKKDTRNILNAKEGRLGDFYFKFINVTHSIPHSSLVSLNTKEGEVLYANDYKLDPHPQIGEKTDFTSLKRVNPKVLIVESLRVSEYRKTPSERIAKLMLEDYLLDEEMKFNGIVVTTFSSQIARLKTLIGCAKKLGREPVLLGRSLSRYYGGALDLGIVEEKVRMVYRRGALNKELEKIGKDKEKYFMMVTGHQGEPDAVLSRIANRKTPFEFEKRDVLVFSATTIPNPINEANKYILKTKLMMQKVRMVEDLHVSGHASREDHRQLLRIVNPEYILPSHGNFEMLSSWGELGEEEGYRIGKEIFVQKNSQILEI
ncbi:MAG: RNase J family beta-CASP ribonuclease [Candidatus Methanofastidiosia archaeon]